VVIADQVAGFIEYRPSEYDRDTVYLMADFPVPGSRYKRLSKLMVLLAVCGETRHRLERIRELKAEHVFTTAFTDRPVSMKYRGVMKKVGDGQQPGGQKFINYQADFNDLTWQETLVLWLTKHSSAS
jgi:hypothetical protein